MTEPEQTDEEYERGCRTCCDTEMAIDTTTRGTTCGGLDVIGGLTCTVCGAGRILKGVTRAAKADDADTKWRLAGGGRSVNCGGVRIRADAKSAKGDAIIELMARIVRLPELEAEIARLKAAMGDEP